MKFAVTGTVAGTAALGAVAWRRWTSDQSLRNRAHAAANVLRGRPTMYRVSLVPPPLLNLAPGTENAFVTEVTLNSGADALVMHA